MISLSGRLAAVCNLVPRTSSLADIGTDHGYVPIFLRETGRIETAVASDIHEGPAARAKEHIEKLGLANVISVRVGPGLSTLAPREANGAVIAGMGGLMIIQILEEGSDVARFLDFLVLQPQNHGKELRLWLAQNGYRIDAETLAREDRRFYEILRVRRGEMNLSDQEAETGLPAFRKNDPLFPDFLSDLIRKKEVTIGKIAPETKNEKNRLMRAQAVLEKQKLEELLWQYKQKISSN